MPDQTDNLNQFARDAGVVDDETAAQMEQSQKPIVIVPGKVVSRFLSRQRTSSGISPQARSFFCVTVVCASL